MVNKTIKAKKWVTYSASGDWHKKVPKGKVGVLMGLSHKRENMYPKKMKQIIIDAKKYTFPKKDFTLTQSQMRKIKERKFTK